MTNPAMESSAVRKRLTEKNTEHRRWVATILLHVWQALGSNFSPENGYFLFFKIKKYLCKVSY
jgi:hypothetical protein